MKWAPGRSAQARPSRYPHSLARRAIGAVAGGAIRSDKQRVADFGYRLRRHRSLLQLAQPSRAVDAGSTRCREQRHHLVRGDLLLSVPRAIVIRPPHDKPHAVTRRNQVEPFIDVPPPHVRVLDRDRDDPDRDLPPSRRCNTSCSKQPERCNGNGDDQRDTHAIPPSACNLIHLSCRGKRPAPESLLASPVDTRRGVGGAGLRAMHTGGAGTRAAMAPCRHADLRACYKQTEAKE